VGSGALATTQQTSLALGVAVLGTVLSLDLSGRTAFVLVLAMMLVVAGAIATFGRSLP
jgi:hypothetical protein